MTISTTENRISYNGNGVTVAFAFPYLFLANDDLDVYLVAADGTSTLLTIVTDYNVTGAGVGSGGTVTMVVAPATGERLVIARVVSMVQETDYISGEAFPAESHERALDRLTMIAQQNADSLGRTLSAPITDPTGGDMTLPGKALRLGKLLGFDPVTGDPNAILSESDISTLNANVAAILNQLLTANSLAWSGFNFDQASPAADAVARLKWNDTDGTLDLGLKGGNVNLQLGQEMVHRLLNNTGAGFLNGQVVYITGSSGQRMTAALALADSEATSSATIAICTEPVANNAEGFATSHGLVRDIDTSAFAEGAVVYLSATVAGGITDTRPAAPNHGVRIGWVVRSHATQGSIFADVQNGHELDELHDVNITAPAALQMLRRNAGNTLWENFSLFATASAWTAPQRVPLTTDNDGNFDIGAAGKQTFKCTPTGAVVLTFSNQADGAHGSVVVINTAGYGFTAHANTKISTSALGRLTATGTYRIDFLSDGTNCYCTVSENLAA